MFSSRSKVLASIFTVGALALASCSSDSSDSSTSTDAAGGDSYRVGSTIVSDGKYHIKKASQIIYPTK